MKKYLTILFLIAFITPSVALASWWNPFSWFNSWNFVKKEIPLQAQVGKQKFPEKKDNEPQEEKSDNSKKQEPAVSPTKTTPAVKEAKKPSSVPAVNNLALIQEQARIQAEAMLKAKAEQDALIDKREADEQTRINAIKAEQERKAIQKQLDDTKNELDKANLRIDSLEEKKKEKPVQPEPTQDLTRIELLSSKNNGRDGFTRTYKAITDDSLFNDHETTYKEWIAQTKDPRSAKYGETPQAHQATGDVVIFIIIKVFDEKGEENKKANVKVTATDSSQDKELKGNGSDYSYSYLFKTPGEHTITFEYNSVKESVTVTAE